MSLEWNRLRGKVITLDERQKVLLKHFRFWKIE